VIVIIDPDAFLLYALKAQKCEQYVVRGGISEAKTLQAGVDSLTKLGYPGLYGISSSMGSPGMRPEDIAMIAKFQHRKISYTTVTVLQNAGSRIIPNTRTEQSPRG